MKKNSKQKKIKVIMILLISIFLLIFICVVNRYKIEAVLYSGNRIIINPMIQINGEIINMDDLIIECKSGEDNYDVDSKKSEISTRGGNYKIYETSITIPCEKNNLLNKDIKINLHYQNANWWYISKSQCSINFIVDNNGNLTSESAIKLETNDNRTESYNSTFKGYDIDITWGI